MDPLRLKAEKDLTGPGSADQPRATGRLRMPFLSAAGGLSSTSR